MGVYPNTVYKFLPTHRDLRRWSVPLRRSVKSQEPSGEAIQIAVSAGKVCKAAQAAAKEVIRLRRDVG